VSRAVEIRPNLLSRLPSARVVAGARSMGGVKCEYCSRQFKNARGLHMHVRTCRKRSVPLHGNFQCGVEAVGQSSSGSAVAEMRSGVTTDKMTEFNSDYPQGKKAVGDTREFNNDYPRGRKVTGSRV